ncbi:SIDT1-like protein [Mya arenaria]|uniref:SIDT1-like protein n=1 Tax=Mya arenaria TaxID=6604 RepID=A0ABY7E6G0_MYAAR|nr:SIDT1-like protein [Mya arenaria]
MCLPNAGQQRCAPEAPFYLFVSTDNGGLTDSDDQEGTSGKKTNHSTGKTSCTKIHSIVAPTVIQQKHCLGQKLDSTNKETSHIEALVLTTQADAEFNVTYTKQTIPNDIFQFQYTYEVLDKVKAVRLYSNSLSAEEEFPVMFVIREERSVIHTKTMTSSPSSPVFFMYKFPDKIDSVLIRASSQDKNKEKWGYVTDQVFERSMSLHGQNDEDEVSRPLTEESSRKSGYGAINDDTIEEPDNLDDNDSVDSSDFDKVDDANHDKNILRTKTRLFVHDLARKSEKKVDKNYKLYAKNLFTIAIFYGLPVIQLVMTYQKSFGIPQHFGLFYAMGMALCMEDRYIFKRLWLLLISDWIKCRRPVHTIWAKEKIAKLTIVLIVLSMVTWTFALYFFLAHLTSWQLSPAGSREGNRECVLLQFYDKHDIWHFLSAISLFFSFLILLLSKQDVW